MCNKQTDSNDGISVTSKQTATMGETSKQTAMAEVVEGEKDEAALGKDEAALSPRPAFRVKRASSLLVVLEHTERYRTGMRVNSLLYFACFLMFGICLVAIGPTIMWIAENTNSAPENVSVIFPVRAIMYCIGSAFGGVALDWLPANAMLALAMMSCGLGMFLLPFAHDIWLVYMCVSAQGIGLGVLDTGLCVMLMRVHGAEVAQYMQTMYLMYCLGCFASPSFILTGAAFVPVALMLIYTRSPPKIMVQPQEGQQGGAQGECEGVCGWQGLFRRLGNGRWVIAAATLMLFLSVGAEVAYGGYLFLYSTRYVNATQEAGYILNSVFWGALAVGRAIGIPWSIYSEPESILMVDMVGCVAALAVPLLVPGEWPLWVATAGYGFFMGPLFPSAMSYVGQACAPLSAAGVAVIIVGESIGQFVFPALLAAIFSASEDTKGLFWFIPVLAANAALALAAFLWMVRCGNNAKHAFQSSLAKEFMHDQFHDVV